MRTQKRFTPKLLDRFLREGRGTGTFEDYSPWHQVSRSDPSSRGRSHLLVWRDRQRELLSDGEWTGLNFASMLHNLVDLVEQFPLCQEDSPFELSRWDIRVGQAVFPGTIAIAKQLGIKHPRLKEQADQRLWTSTTDLLLVLRRSDGMLELLAVSCKPGTVADLSSRANQLLDLERSYWAARGVRWLLITPSLYEKSVALTLRRTAPWGLADIAEDVELELACRTAQSMPYHSETDVLHEIARQLQAGDDLFVAQRALWQCIWQGLFPIDLRRGHRPHVPFKHITVNQFDLMNPIAARRSAWI